MKITMKFVDSRFSKAAMHHYFTKGGCREMDFKLNTTEEVKSYNDFKNDPDIMVVSEFVHEEKCEECGKAR
jgi:hypothetical protein